MIRSRIVAIVGAMSLMVAACARPELAAGGVPVTASPTLEQLQGGYDAADGFARLILPYVSSARAARIRLALDLVGRALETARAKQGAERAAAMRKVVDEQAALDAALDST